MDSGSDGLWVSTLECRRCRSPQKTRLPRESLNLRGTAGISCRSPLATVGLCTETLAKPRWRTETKLRLRPYQHFLFSFQMKKASTSMSCDRSHDSVRSRRRVQHEQQVLRSVGSMLCNYYNCRLRTAVAANHLWGVEGNDSSECRRRKGKVA